MFLAAPERRRQRNARQEQAAQKGQGAQKEQAAQKGQTTQKEQAAQTEQTAQAGRGRGKKQAEDAPDRQESRQNQPKRQENRPKQSQRQGKQEKTGGPAPRQYSEQMNLKPSHRHPKKYEYKDNTRLKDDIITYTPDWGSPPSAPRFQPSSSARKKPQDQPLSDKPFRR